MTQLTATLIVAGQMYKIILGFPASLMRIRWSKKSMYVYPYVIRRTQNVQVPFQLFLFNYHCPVLR